MFWQDLAIVLRGLEKNREGFKVLLVKKEIHQLAWILNSWWNVLVLILGRPDANEVLQHPLFWNAKKRLSFLRDASDRAEDINSKLSIALNRTADAVLVQYSKVKNWYTKVGKKIMCHMCKYRSYDKSSVQDLLRVIRNMFNHYEELPTKIQVIGIVVFLSEIFTDI